jgi:threonine aldolase
MVTVHRQGGGGCSTTAAPVGRQVLATWDSVRAMPFDPGEVARLRAGATRSLAGNGAVPPTEILSAIPADVEPDRYGDGGVVSELEAEVADLLGFPAAVFMPSGTMAQQIALRIHADRNGRRTVAFHPTCHVAEDEGGAFERLHGLVPRPVGDRHALVDLEALSEIAEPLGSLLLELPQRTIGGQLPSWDDLQMQVQWARDRGAAAHLDGARLWQCPPAYDRPLDEIAGLFDTVYVSFYKDLGGAAGCCLLGQQDVIAESREWRRRHGGALFALWPYAVSALAVLRTRLPRMSDYRQHALALAGALRDLDGVRLVPDPPQTSMFHILLRGDGAAIREKMLTIAAEERIWTWPDTFSSGHPDWRVVELSVGDATLDFSLAEATDLVGRLVGHD